jgi:predicted helicase
VKFIRFAEWRIEQTGQGVVAFITNHAYLDNPTFRGMRAHLLHTFQRLYIVNLHGNARRKERAPNGSPDENLFDIQQGVAILIAIRNPQQLPQRRRKDKHRRRIAKHSRWRRKHRR